MHFCGEKNYNSYTAMRSNEGGVACKPGLQASAIRKGELACRPSTDVSKNAVYVHKKLILQCFSLYKGEALFPSLFCFIYFQFNAKFLILSCESA